MLWPERQGCSANVSRSLKPNSSAEQSARSAYAPFGMASGQGPVGLRLTLRFRGKGATPSKMAPQATGNERLVPREWIEGVGRLRQLQPHTTFLVIDRQFIED